MQSALKGLLPWKGQEHTLKGCACCTRTLKGKNIFKLRSLEREENASKKPCRMAPPAVSPAAAVKQWLRAANAANACGNSNTGGRAERCAWQASWPRKIANNQYVRQLGSAGTARTKPCSMWRPSCSARSRVPQSSSGHNHMSPQAWAFWPASKAALAAYMIYRAGFLWNVCLDPQFLHGVSQHPGNVVLQVLHCQNPFLVYPHRSSAYTHLSTKRPDIASRVLVQVPGQLQKKLTNVFCEQMLGPCRLDQVIG